MSQLLFLCRSMEKSRVAKPSKSEQHPSQSLKEWNVVHRSTRARMLHCKDCSYNKNKLFVHMYIVKNTTIFLIVRLILLRYNYMFRPSMLAIFRLYMKHLAISYIYTWLRVQFVGWGGCEISFCVCRRRVDRVYLGVLLKYLSCLLSTISIGYIFDDVFSYIGNYINMDYV